MSSSVSGMMICRRPSASCSSLISPAHSRCVSYGRHSLFQPGGALSHRGISRSIVGLRLGDRAREVAPADAELHRRVPDAVLAVDDRRALDDLDVGDLPERDVRAVGRRHGDLADGLEAHPVLRLPAHGQVEELLALVHLGDRLPADGRLDDRVDVARVEAVARARLALRDDLDARLPERLELPEVLHAADLAHHVDDRARRSSRCSRGRCRTP